MAWSNDTQQSTSGAFDWALFIVGAALGFFAGWAKRLVFAILGTKSKK